MGKTLRELMFEHERTILVATLKQNGNDRSLAAKALGITLRALEKALLRHHLVKRRYTRPLPTPGMKIKITGTRERTVRSTTEVDVTVSPDVVAVALGAELVETDDENENE